MRLTIALAAALAAAPVAAQTAPATPPAPSSAAPVDPATLAAARRVVGHLMPPGIYKQVMGPVMGSLMDNMGGVVKALPLRRLAELGGLSHAQAEKLGEVDVAEAMAIYDPHWEERSQLSFRAIMDAMGDFLTTMEPGLREAMAKAYARRFTPAELADVDRFFTTPSGAKFASQYMTIAADPEMAAAMRSMMPSMIDHMPEFLEAAQKATASVPAPRKLQDLTPAEKAKLARALGVPESKLQDPKSPL